MKYKSKSIIDLNMYVSCVCNISFRQFEHILFMWNVEEIITLLKRSANINNASDKIRVKY